jgi:bacterioferritin
VQPEPVKPTDDNKEMLRADLNNENDTIKNYRLRVRQCEELGEYAMAELVREILIDEQDHQIALATALGIDPPKL